MFCFTCPFHSWGKARCSTELQYAKDNPESKDNAAKTLMLWCVEGVGFVPSDNTSEAMARARQAHRRLKKTLKLPLQFSEADIASMKIATDDERLPQAVCTRPRIKKNRKASSKKPCQSASASEAVARGASAGSASTVVAEAAPAAGQSSSSSSSSSSTSSSSDS